MNRKRELWDNGTIVVGLHIKDILLGKNLPYGYVHFTWSISLLSSFLLFFFSIFQTRFMRLCIDEINSVHNLIAEHSFLQESCTNFESRSCRYIVTVLKTVAPPNFICLSVCSTFTAYISVTTGRIWWNLVKILELGFDWL